MLSHDRVWAAIDALAARYSLSASGLAKRAGLDSTAFNKSKRLSADGRPRWPSTELLAKIIEATNSSLDEFFSLIEGKAKGGDRPLPTQSSTVPLLGFAQAGAGGFFDDAGFPAGQGWDLIELPAQSGEGSYALQVQGDSMLPLYRNGDVLVVAAPRQGSQRRPRRRQDQLRRGHGKSARAAHGDDDRSRLAQSGASRQAACRRRCRMAGPHRLGKPVGPARPMRRAPLLAAAALVLGGVLVLIGGRMVANPVAAVAPAPAAPHDRRRACRTCACRLRRARPDLLAPGRPQDRRTARNRPEPIAAGAAARAA